MVSIKCMTVYSQSQGHSVFFSFSLLILNLVHHLVHFIGLQGPHLLRL